MPRLETVSDPDEFDVRRVGGQKRLQRTFEDLPASLLVEEAGGRVTGLDGQPLRFNQPSPLLPGMIASNGLLHEDLLS